MASLSSSFVFLELYFDKDASYKEDLSEIRRSCKSLEKDHKISSFLQFQKSDLEPKKVKVVEDDIRGLIPQERGSIVTTRGFMLPLSNSKNLNLSNTPVLLAKSKERLVYVFPCLIGETYFGVLRGIEYLKANLPSLPPISGQMEDEITERVLRDIERFEKGLALVGRELETSAGLADLVFADTQDRRLIVEVEREADEHALGQVLRLSAAYEKKFGLTRDRVRAMIACVRIHEFIRDAAERAGVEIWVV
jgi:hypothetical protein